MVTLRKSKRVGFHLQRQGRTDVTHRLYSLIGWGCVQRSACRATGRRSRQLAPGSARDAPGSPGSGKTSRPPAEGPLWSRCRAVWEDACSPGGTRQVVNYWLRYRVQDKLKMSPSSDGTACACQVQFILDTRSKKTGIKDTFKTRQHLHKLFRRMLRQCFGDYKTSPDFPSTW